MRHKHATFTKFQKNFLALQHENNSRTFLNKLVAFDYTLSDSKFVIEVFEKERKACCSQ